MSDIREKIGTKRLYLDGGFGSMLQERGLKAGELPELWNLTHPREVSAIHREYIEAGANIITANTFGANPLKYPDNLKEIISAAIGNVKTAISESGRDDVYAAMDVSTLGKLLAPLGDLDFEDAFSYFKEMIDAGTKAGADLVLIETMSDVYEAKVAVLAAKEVCNLPVIVSCTFDESGKMLTGANPKTMVAIMEGLGVDAVGINCGLGPKQVLPLVREIMEVSSTPVVVYPNAGLPRVENGKTVYDIGPEEFGSLMSEIGKLGVWAMGGCCGTTPEFIKSTINKTKSLPFVPIEKKSTTVVTSFSRTVEIGKKPVIVGERINPTGKPKFKRALIEEDYDYILSQALEQENSGAEILDVNVGLPEIDEIRILRTVVEKIQGVSPLPLQLDTSNAGAMEKAMRYYNGKPLINSVSGEQESMDKIFPLVAKYGGVVVCLLLDESGIPEDVKGRINIAQKIIKEAKNYGIEEKDLIMDGLTMAISAGADGAKITLDTVKALTERGLHSTLGVSNVSFGLPKREIINSFFLTLCLERGLSAAIINPGNPRMIEAVDSYLALFGYDENLSNYIEKYKDKEENRQPKSQPSAEPSRMSLKDSVINGLKEVSVENAKKALGNKAPMDILNQDIIPALDVVGVKYEEGSFYLPQLLMAADAAKAALELVKEQLSHTSETLREKIVIATVKGDIHDIGKNIVKILLENYGYQVIDLGKDVAPQTIIDTVERENVKTIGLSALMTTTVPAMEETIKLIRGMKKDLKVIVGGAVMTQNYADMIGADYYAKDAMQTVRICDEIFGH